MTTPLDCRTKNRNAVHSFWLGVVDNVNKVPQKLIHNEELINWLILDKEANSQAET